MDDINKYSDTQRVVKNAKSYLGSDVDIRLRTGKTKNSWYMIQKIENGYISDKWDIKTILKQAIKLKEIDIFQEHTI